MMAMTTKNQGDPGQDSESRGTPLHSARERVFGLRGKLVYYYRENSRVAKELNSERKDWAKQRSDLYLEFVQLADSFEAVFRMCNQDRKLRKQKAVLKCFEVTYMALLHTLEQHGLYCVPIKGKAYRQVTFQGLVIPEPWEVVQSGEDIDAQCARTVRTVLQSLWIRVVSNKVEVVRRAQVTY